MALVDGDEGYGPVSHWDRTEGGQMHGQHEAEIALAIGKPIHAVMGGVLVVRVKARATHSASAREFWGGLFVVRSSAFVASRAL